MDSDKKKSMWGGRFAGDPDEFMMKFGASIRVDIELLDADIQGSTAWAEALGKAGLLNDDEVRKIITGLNEVHAAMKAELVEGTFAFDSSLEDIHMTVESRLTDIIGDSGAKLHMGRSRNDQVALDERLYLLGALDSIDFSVKSLQEVIIGKAEQYIDAVAPSYTHLQQAQPVRLGHYLMAWFWMLNRDRERFSCARKRTDSMPLGSGAVAGCGFDIDRTFIAEKLGFSGITENSIDAVSDRDYIIETLSAASILMMHLSRMCEDLIVWASGEFGFAGISDGFSTGSSMMPQKKNPDSLELVRGKTGRVYGNLMTLLTVMKGLPFSYGKDMQEDKEPLFDTIHTVQGCLRIMHGVMSGITFDTKRMEASFDSSVFATDIADYLTEKGLPFRKSHEVAGQLVKWSQEHSTEINSIPMKIFREHSDLFEDDVKNIFDLRKSADRRSLPGGTGKRALLDQIAQAREVLKT
ncbi:argininosuccinate lyase [Candidatus Latescibacterota bacterium]